MDDRNIKLNYGEEFEYENKPHTSFQFPDFYLVYMGYLPSAYELGLSKNIFFGLHMFNIVELNSEGKMLKGSYISWTSGSGVLTPTTFNVNGINYEFTPYSQNGKKCTVVPKVENTVTQ